MNKDPNIIESLLAEISLEETIKTGLMMSDYENWSEGEYKGDRKMIDDQTECVVRILEVWEKEGFKRSIRK